MEKGEGQEVGEKEKKEKSLELCSGFSRLISRSIFNNRENDIPYSTYVVAIISV